MYHKLSMEFLIYIYCNKYSRFSTLSFIFLIFVSFNTPFNENNVKLHTRLYSDTYPFAIEPYLIYVEHVKLIKYGRLAAHYGIITHPKYTWDCLICIQTPATHKHITPLFIMYSLFTRIHLISQCHIRMMDLHHLII